MNQYSVADKKIYSLLISKGLPDAYTIERIPAGGNNRVYKLTCDNGEVYLLKEYFSNKSDSRDRLRTEFSFLSFLWNNGIRTIPEPITSSRSDNLGLYRFIPGSSITKDEVTENRVNEMVLFFSAINQLRDFPESRELPDASDACFSIQGHLDHIQGRIDRLSMIQTHSESDLLTLEFINNLLIPGWKRVRRGIIQKLEGDDSRYTPIPMNMRVLSPSDFGFHNTILKPNDSLIFIDFEYAGWDDPVKTICDLFCQPKIPVSLLFFKAVCESMIQISGWSTKQWKVRTDLLYPAYQIKWCCIILNDFLPVGGSRRMFADSNYSSENHKLSQLRKAEEFFRAIILD